MREREHTRERAHERESTREREREKEQHTINNVCLLAPLETEHATKNTGTKSKFFTTQIQNPQKKSVLVASQWTRQELNGVDKTHNAN